MLVLDSGAISRLAERSTRALALLRSLRAAQLWPPVVPSVVLVESLQGHPGRDANVNRFLKTCIVDDKIAIEVARRAAHLRRLARRGSAVDAVLVAVAEPDGIVLTGDAADLQALAAHADGVGVGLV
jgi:predicted nucleic acid-binding protein